MARSSLLVALTLAGCIQTRTVEVKDTPVADGGATRVVESYVQGEQALDILFVVDDTQGMAASQARLASAFGALVTYLQAAKIDWRAGVVSTDLGIDPHGGPGCERAGGDRAELQRTPRIAGCPAPPDPYLTASNVADAEASFACIATLGEGGCGFERPIAAALRALDPAAAPSANAGFLRASAALLVVWLSNEDDCSAVDAKLYDPDDLTLGSWGSGRCFAQDIDCTGKAPDGSLTGCTSGKGPYLTKTANAAAALRALKPAGTVGALAIVGPSSPVKVQGSGVETQVDPSCTTADVEARPGIRFAELVAPFGDTGGLISICAPDLGGQLVAAVSRLKTAPARYCLRHALRDAARPGCSVEVISASGQSWRVPPSGPGVAGFHLVHPVAGGCAAGALAFDDGALPPAGATVNLRCAFVP